MPTAEEFYAAKGDVEELLSTLQDIASDVEAVHGETGFVGATIQTTVNSGISNTFNLKRQAATAGQQLVAELEYRARVCEQHAAALLAWQTGMANAPDEAAVEALGPRPRPPHPWVEPQ